MELLILFFVAGLILGLIFGLLVGFCLAMKALLIPEDRELFWTIFWASFRQEFKPRRQRGKIRTFKCKRGIRLEKAVKGK